MRFDSEPSKSDLPESFPSVKNSASQAADKDSGPTSAGFICRTLLSCIDSFSESELENFRSIVALENFAFRDIMKYGWIVSGYSIDHVLFRRATELPACRWVKAALSELGEFDIEGVILAGTTLLARLRAPLSTKSAPANEILNNNRKDAGLNLRESMSMSSITLYSVSFTAAIMANARHLQIAPHDIISEHSQSPFYLTRASLGKNPALQNSAPASYFGPRRDTDDGDSFYEDIKPDLRPTRIQTNIPHHPCLDVLPWPTFRSNAIMAASMDPPPIDEDDLCLDMLNDGIRCWGSTAMSLHGHGQGSPWDSRSWEAAPWFLQKWESLIGGKDGEMWKDSSWWQSMRKC